MAWAWNDLFKRCCPYYRFWGKISGALAVNYNVAYCLHVLNNKGSPSALVRSPSLNWMGTEIPTPEKQCGWKGDGL